MTSASAGGAGIAASRVAHALREHGGHSVDIFDIETAGPVSQEVSPQRSVTNGRLSNTQFTADYGTAHRAWLVRTLAGYDLVNAHWTTYLQSIADLEALAATGVPLLLTLHDANYVTGGCHYAAGCTGLFSGCHACPQVNTEVFARAEVQRVKARKDALLARPNVHLSAPSRYMLEQAAHAAPVPQQRLHLLRNPYAPLEIETAVPPRPFTVLLVADSLTERRKGARLAAEALLLFCMRQGRDNPVRIHVAGNADESLLRSLRATGAELLAHGRLTNHRWLVEVYRTSDLQICPSHEDNWPNVLVEAAAYGCLAIVGPGHGCEEFARAYDAGTVCTEYSATAFADALSGIAAMPADERELWREELAARVIADHAPDRIAADFNDAFACIVGSEPAEDPRERLGGLWSSNYLGAATREMLVAPAARGAEAGDLVVTRRRAATSSGTLALSAVYDGAAGPVPVPFQPERGEARVPVHHNGGRLRHVFAAEANDYGVSQLGCRIDGDAPD
nr:glycosyltransferase [Rubrivivax gelatinosus]